MTTISTDQARTELLAILKEKSFQRKRVVLASGKESDYYLDARISSLCGRGAFLIARLMLEMLGNETVDAVGGLTLGADPIIGAIAALSGSRPNPINGFIVRKQEKKHGMARLIEGPQLTPETRVVIVDDVITTGSSTIKAIEAVQAVGCPIIRVLAVVDRNEGGRENIATYGLKLESLFTIQDFL